MKKYIQKNFKNIEQIADKNVLYDNLSDETLSDIEIIIDAYLNEQIDFKKPIYDNNGHIDFDKLELVVKDKSYKEKGFELLVIKWFESFEDTGYLVECLK